MTLFLSHQIERLVDSLAEQLSENRSPCDAIDVILPGLVQKQWLMVSLAERLSSHSLASVRFLSWREALLLACPDNHLLNRLELQLLLSQIFSSEIDPEDPLFCLSWAKESLIEQLSDQMLMAGFYAMDPKEPWQCSLLKRLSPWRFPVQIYPGQKPLARQIHCFCVDEMPAAAWRFFFQSPQCYVYLFSPCCMFWEDLLTDAQRRRCLREKRTVASTEAMETYLRDTHPLLANWGRLGRETIRHFDDFDVRELYDEGEPHSLLQTIQQDLLFLRTTPRLESKTPDDSISVIMAGSSMLREVQILKDQILAQKKISYSEILVLAPDIRPYEPLIQFVFGDIPVRIAPVAVLPQNAALQAFLLFLSLSDRNFEVDAVLELFENPAFQQRHRLNSEDLEWFRRWLQEAQVREGWKEGRGGWPDGLKRMLAGLVYLLPEEDPLPRIQTVDWGQADRLNHLMELVQNLYQYAQQFAGPARPLTEWIQPLQEAVAFVIEPEEEILSAFLRKTIFASVHFPNERFPFSILRKHLENDSQQASSAYQGHLWEAIQFSSLIPGAIRPARFLFLLGMDSESFPRQSSRSTLDWEQSQPDAAEQDRYLLLQALFSAREHLTISYRHLSAEDGQTVEPALPIQELLQLIATFYPGQTIAPTAHPTMACDPRYFQKDGKLRSVSMEAFRAANTPEAPSVFWPKSVKTEMRIFDLADLALVARHPWNYFLQRKLGIYVKNETLFSEKRLDDFVLPPYVEQKILKRALKRPIDEVIAQYAEELPPGSFGDWTKAQLKKKANEWQSHLQKWGIRSDEIFSVRFSPHCQEKAVSEGHIEMPPIRIAQMEIVGEIDLVTPLGLLSANEPSFFNGLRHWPHLLASMALFPTSPTLLSLKKGTAKTWKIEAEAWQKWIDYVLRAQESLSPLIHPWAEAFLLKGKEEWKQIAEKSLMSEEDPTIRFVWERAQPLPLDQIWDDWSDLVEKWAGYVDV